MRIEVNPDAREELLEFLRRADCEARADGDEAVIVEVPGRRRGPGPPRGRPVPEGLAGQPPRRRRSSALDSLTRGSRAKPKHPIELVTCAASSPSRGGDLTPRRRAAAATIRPQYGMSRVVLGMTKAQVRARLGAPIGTGGGRFYYARVWVGFRLGRVTEVTTTRSTERTASGLGVDSSEACCPQRISVRRLRLVRRFSPLSSRERQAGNAGNRLPSRPRPRHPGERPALAGLAEPSR